MASRSPEELTFTAATRTIETVSPMGRRTVGILDSQGRVVEPQPAFPLPLSWYPRASDVDAGRATG